MSWRRFQVLLRGLSPNAATVVKLSSKGTIGGKREKVHEVKGPVAAQRAFETLFAPPSKPRAE